MREKIIKHGYKILLLMLWGLLLIDIFYRIIIFPAEVVAMHDYFLIVAFPMIYYISRQRKNRMAMKGSMLGFIVSLISKFGFMAGSVLIWR